LAVALSAGVDTRTVILGEARRTSGRVRNALQHVSDAVASGTSLGDALAHSGAVFPVVFKELVLLGDETGHLPEVFQKLADHYSHQVQLRRQFLSAITWPIIQLVAAIFIVGGLIWILGAIGPQPFDILGLGLVGSRGLAIYVVIVSGIGIAVVGLIRLVTSESAWGGWLQRLLLRVPLIRATISNLALARFTWAAGLALQGGMEVRRALAAGLRTARSVVYTAEIPAITERIEQRQTIHESLAASNVFPKQLLDMIDVGEQSGQLPETLLRMSDEYQERARANLKTWATVGGFLVWAFVALVIGAIIVNIMRTYVGAINRAATP
jgi:type IV pilus assembly protein PilC